MAIGTGLAVAGLVNAGMQLFGAHKASSAAKDAAKIQSQAADKAMGVTRDVYQTQMAGMDPYANVGRQSMNILGRLTSPSQPYTPRLQAQDARQGYTAYGGGQPPAGSGGPFGGMSRPPQGGGGMAQPRPSTFGGMGGGGQAQPPRMVLLQAPDGSQRPVPETQVQSYLARGATMVQQQ